MKKLISLLPVFALLCGCYPYTEIENTDILTSLYADIENETLLLGGGVANVRSFSDAMANEPVSLIRAEGDSLDTAVTHLKQSADHELFFGALRAVIFGESLAKTDIRTLIRYLDAQPRLRRSTAVFVTDSSLKDVVSHKAVNDFSGGFAAESIVSTLYALGEMRYTSIGDILYALSYGDAGYCIPHITVKDGMLQADGYSLFVGGKRVGFTASPAVAFFTVPHAAQQHIVNGTPLVTKLTRKSVCPKIQNGKLHISAKLVFSLKQGKGTQTLQPARRKEIAAQLSKKLKKEITDALIQSRDTGCDFLELYKYRMAQNRAEFDMKNWNTMLKSMTFDVEVVLK